MEPDPVERMYNENPIIKFSSYTHIQSKILETLGQEIVQCLEAGIVAVADDGHAIQCDPETIGRAYGKSWLWVLGAYEVVRTMWEARECFSSRVEPQLKGLKERLELLRMPFAKQELPRKIAKNRPIGAEPSIYGIDHSPADLKYQVNGQVLSIRQMVHEFSVVLSGISRADILTEHRTSYLSREDKAAKSKRKGKPTE